jgi:lipopolysaccharide biosynthesis regulator YciM
MAEHQVFPRTDAVRRAIQHDSRTAADLLFLERWEMAPQDSVGAVLRVQQIRRANPNLVAELRAELVRARDRQREPA